MEPIPAFDHAVTFCTYCIPPVSASRYIPVKGLHHYSTSWISYVFSCSRGCHRFSGAERMTIMMSYITTLLKALVPLLVLVSHQLNYRHKNIASVPQF
jgi:hypothetical protein